MKMYLLNLFLEMVKIINKIKTNANSGKSKVVNRFTYVYLDEFIREECGFSMVIVGMK